MCLEASMKVVLRRILTDKRQGAPFAEETVIDGDWMEAVEVAYNRVMSREMMGVRYVLVVDEYRGGGWQQPIGQHRIMLAVYDDAAKRYLYDDPIRVEVIQE
jgi:hypothetical protein